MRMRFKKWEKVISQLIGPPAVIGSQSDREGADDLASRADRDDAVGPNPPVGRSTADVGSLKARNRMLRIATWNVRSLNKPGVYKNVCREMDAMRLDILGLSEAWWIGSGSVM